jgi:uncharacterized membrane protein
MAKRSVQKTTQTALENKQSDNGLTVPPPIIDDRGLAFAVYVLYLVGYITGITVLIGAVIAYSQATRSARSPIKSHYTFQVRTFWIGLIYLLVGILLLHLGVGVLILLWGFVWSLVRNVKGLLALNRNESIANPESWMFGD